MTQGMWAGRRAGIGFVSLAAAGIALAGVSGAQEPAGGRPPVASKVEDAAGLFADRAVAEASKTALPRIERETGVSTVIETVESFQGKPAEAHARQFAERQKNPGVYVLIGRRDRKLEVVTSPALAKAIPSTELVKVRDAFLDQFRNSDYDQGLAQGVRAIEGVLARANAENRLPRASAAGSGLVVRNQARLTLKGARVILAAAEQKAAAMGLKVNVAVVDDGGHLLSFARMDGARPASGYTAITKATTAATFRQDTGPLPKGTTNPDPLLNLSLQNAAAASGGKVTTLYGGIAVVVDGQVIGGVGVGGGSGEQDAEVARAGVARLLSELGAAPAAENARAAETSR